MENKNQPAFPVEVSVDENGNLRGSQTSNFSGFEMGLTKREYFAGLAMQGLLANPNICRPQSGDEDKHQQFSSVCIKYADELLKQLENGK